MAVLIFPHSLKEFSREQRGEGRNWGFGRTLPHGSLPADCKNNDASERKEKKMKNNSWESGDKLDEQ